ncbi:tetratricopeptide repeat protein [Spirulina sp. CS-785/01]|uniref:tetratricopeptide repeat protein n=1 Tax=Spirulina sp. CS-785/01 TaxID=3021716 RepID=UPI00232B8CF9|nr:tetratricopeptide repeat protein [Spirulina sp. CS-785/01]MDB9314488.1 tetratricopeptide repeat protein [Spirulina sp. CS-785/01]
MMVSDFLESRCETPEVWYKRGRELSDRGENQEALTNLEQAIAIAPYDGAIWYEQARVLEKLGRFGDAFTSYQQAAQLTPGDYWAWYNAGYVAMEELRDYESAIAAFNQALHIRPQDYWSGYRKAESLRRKRDWKTAIVIFEQVLTLRPEDYWSFYRKGDAHFHGQQYQDALYCYETCLSLKPQDYWAQKQRANTLKQLGAVHSAILRFNQLLQHEPTDAAIWYDLTHCYAQLNDINGIIRTLERAIILEPVIYFQQLETDPILTRFRQHPELQGVLEELTIRFRETLQPDATEELEAS